MSFLKIFKKGNFEEEYFKILKQSALIPSNYVINDHLSFNINVLFNSKDVNYVKEMIKECENYITSIIKYKKKWDKIIDQHIVLIHKFRIKYEGINSSNLIIDNLIMRSNKSKISLKLFGEHNLEICRITISRLTNLLLVLQNKDNGHICLDCYYNINYYNSIYLECSRCKIIVGLCEGCFNSDTCESVVYTDTKKCSHVLCRDCYTHNPNCDLCLELECPICYSEIKKSEMIKNKCEGDHYLCKECHIKLRESKCDYYWKFGKCNKMCNNFTGCDNKPEPTCPLCRGKFIR